MKKQFHVFLTIGCLVFFNPTATEANAEPEIVNGKVTEEYKTTALILLSGQPLCSGTLIASKVVLTAAHCIVGHMSEDLIKSGQVTVIFGTYYQSPIIPPIKVRATKYPNSGKLAFNDKTLRNDVGLIFLEDEVAIKNVVPAKLNDDANSWKLMRDKNILLTFVGFGADPLNKTNSDPGTKRKASWSITSFDDKNISYKSQDNQNTCFKDSGGPAYMGLEETPVIWAIASGNNKNCTFGFSARVDYYRQWILENLE